MSSWTGCTSTSDANPCNRSTNMSFETALGSEACCSRAFRRPSPPAVRSARPDRARRNPPLLRDRDPNLFRNHRRLEHPVLGVAEHELERMLAWRQVETSLGLP